MSHRALLGVIATLVVGSLVVVGTVIAQQSTNTISDGVSVGTISLAGMTRAQAISALEDRWKIFKEQGISLRLGQSHETIRVETLGARLDVDATVDAAWAIGRNGSLVQQLRDRFAPDQTFVPTTLEFSREALNDEVKTVSDRYDQPRLDVRFVVEGNTLDVRVDDVHAGTVVDQELLQQIIEVQLRSLNTSEITVVFKPDLPHADPASASAALERARAMVALPIILSDGADQYTISQGQLVSLITSGYEGNHLVPELKQERLAEIVVHIALSINTEYQATQLRVVGNKVVDFVPPRSGRKLEEENTIAMITEVLMARSSRVEDASSGVLAAPVVVTHPQPEASAASLGITQRIGKATTTFVGSPANRKANIKNGVRFLGGVIIAPGEEFSTLKTLGRIDNTTGYLPELVIKENRTIPEYGGGLRPGSSTTVRAVMNAGLPITQRQNHSYRVPYYERDGQGRTIGPGLDATIYSPAPDFRFLNDTPTSIVIQGYTKGDTITFELYGTNDGRTATIDGPHTLSTVPPGPDIVVETDTLTPGTKKKLESAHPGGTAIATYTVTYPDGTKKTQVFKSSYKRWPARYLIGVTPKSPEAIFEGNSLPE